MLLAEHPMHSHPWLWMLIMLLIALARAGDKSKPSKPPEKPSNPAHKQTDKNPSNPKPETLEARLEELKTFKEKGLISDAEAEKLRRKLLEL
jgi:hypothetical protein